jgi:hypothetical protein
MVLVKFNDPTVKNSIATHCFNDLKFS